MDDIEFAEAIQFIGSNEVELRDNYDAVFHLVTAAKGAEEFYTTANNSARTETVEEAAALDDKLISAWTGHPHLRVIDNTSTFEDTLNVTSPFPNLVSSYKFSIIPEYFMIQFWHILETIFQSVFY